MLSKSALKKKQKNPKNPKKKQKTQNKKPTKHCQWPVYISWRLIGSQGYSDHMGFGKASSFSGAYCHPVSSIPLSSPKTIGSICQGKGKIDIEYKTRSICYSYLSRLMTWSVSQGLGCSPKNYNWAVTDF